MRLLESTLPIEVLVRGRRCVVVGDTVATREKAERLRAAGAVVEHFAGPITGTDSLTPIPPSGVELAGALVTFVAREEVALGKVLAERAVREGRLVCTLDEPDHATFINPAIAEVSGLRVSVSSGGVSPTVARRVRDGIRTALASPALEALMQRLAAVRAKSGAMSTEFTTLRELAERIELRGMTIVPSDAPGDSHGDADVG